MPIDEQVIKLALDLGASPEEAAKLSAALDRINTAGAKAATDGLAKAEAEINALIGASTSAAIPLEATSDLLDRAAIAAAAAAAAEREAAEAAEALARSQAEEARAAAVAAENERRLNEIREIERRETEALALASADLERALIETRTAAASAAIPLEEVSLEMVQGSRGALTEAQALRALGIEMRETAVASHQLDAATTRYHGSAATAMGRTKDVSGAILQLSYGVQDVAIGSFAGLINNVDQFALRMGASGPVVIGVSLLTTGIYVASRAIGSLMDEFAHASGHAIPRTGDALKDVSRDLDDTSKRLDKLRDAGRLNNEELAEFNRLSQEEIRLTREKDAIKKERDIAEKAAALKPAGEAEQAKQVAEALQGSFGDEKSRQDLIARVLAGMPTEALDRAKRESGAANRALQESLTKDPLNLVGMQDALQRKADEAMARVRAESARMRSEAEAIVNRAVVEGDLGAFGRLRGAIGARPGAFTAAQRAAIEQASPEAFAADDAFERQLAERKQAVKERDDQAKEAKKKADAKAKADADDIEAGREMELAGREGHARMQAKFAADIEKSMKAEDEMNARLERLWAKQDKAKADAAGDVIRQATGGALGADLTREAAEMSVQLQRQGLDANEATQQAIGAALQAMQQMASEAAMQRRDSMMLIQQAAALQQAMRAEFNPRLQPFQPRAR
ncbi:MAG: hypothetical protein VW239_00105 [Candidatus Nanopelagicales bacterium]